MILYLEIGAKIKRALLEEDVGFLERVYLIWYCHFFFQRWQQWLKSPLNPYPKGLLTYSMPPTQLLDSIEIAANNMALAIIIMAEYYPDCPLLPETLTTSKLENLFSSVRNSGDCKSSKTYGEVLYSLRNAVAKESCKAESLRHTNKVTSQRSRYPENPFPSNIPDLRSQVNKAIDSAKKDVSEKVKNIFDLSPENEHNTFEHNQDEMFLPTDLAPQEQMYEDANDGDEHLEHPEVSLVNVS